MMCEKALYQLRDFRGYKAVSATLKGTECAFTSIILLLSLVEVCDHDSLLKSGH